MRAQQNRDWTDAEIVTEPSQANIVHTAQLPAEWSEALEAEAARRGVTPTRLMLDYIVWGLQHHDAAPEGTAPGAPPDV